MFLFVKLYESLAAGAGYRVGKSLTGGGFNAKMSRLMMMMVMMVMTMMMMVFQQILILILIFFKLGSNLSSGKFVELEPRQC